MRHFFTHWNGMMAILLLFILITNPKRAWDIALEQCGIFRCGQVIFRNFNSSFWYAKLISRNFYKRIAIRNHPNKYFQFLLSALFNLKKTLFPVHNCGLAARAMAKASAWAGTDLLILNLSSLSRPSGRIKLPVWKHGVKVISVELIRTCIQHVNFLGVPRNLAASLKLMSTEGFPDLGGQHQNLSFFCPISIHLKKWK